MKPSTPSKSSGQGKSTPQTASSKPMSARPAAGGAHGKPASGKK